MINEKKALSVALVANLLPPYRISLYNQIHADPEVDLEVLLCSWREQDRSWEVDAEEINFPYRTYQGINTHIRTSHSRSDYYHIHFNLALLADLIKSEYDAVIFSGYASITHQIAFWISKMRRVPTLLWYRSHDTSQSAVRKMLTPYVDRLINKSDVLLAPGKKTKNFLLDRGAEHKDIFIVGNTIDNESYKEKCSIHQQIGKEETRRQLDLSNEKIILFVGRLVDVKGLYILLDSFKDLKSALPEALLLIVGDGYLKNDLIEYCANNQIGSVRFDGFVQPSELGKYYTAADILVLPSYYETWGLVINEAMIFGLPVVTTTNVGAAGEIVLSQETGLTVPPGDPDSLTSAIYSILSSERLRMEMGERARAVIANHTPDTAAKIFAAAIHHAIRGKDRT